ncbi:MAG: cell division protein ZapA [Clostridia bacterium]
MKTTKIRICNTEYLIKGNESEEYVEKIALFVDKKMSSIMRENPKLSVSMAAVLTAVNISDDYFKERDQANKQKAFMDDIEKKSKEQISRIKMLEAKIEKLSLANTELKETLTQTEEQLKKAQNEFR